MAADVGVSVLGPFEVSTAGRTVPIVGVKLQSLLGLLALAVPHGVSDDRLLDELWGDRPPAKPANALQALVSHLRRVLGRDTIVRHGNGYALRIEPAAVDALRLEQLVHEGRLRTERGDHDAAAGCFRAAIGLVRGTPFAELADHWFARDAASRIDELLLAAREALVDSELAMGHHLDVLTMVGDLVTQHPVHERFRAQLIVALYRCGRQVEALQAYRDARAYLLDELGLDPGPELRQLERAVLAHDPALAAPIALTSAVANRPELPVPLTSFVGRADELATIEQAVTTTRLVSLVGPGGVGKTRLAVELARRLADRQELWFVELAPVHHGSGAAAATIALGVGAPERDAVSAPPLQRAVERLRERPAILVLDNCEHVVDDIAPVILGLLAGCPGLRIVTTTREPIGVEGERQVAVRPLGDEDAVALFVERARDAQPMFDPAGSDAQLAPLIEHLDGLPLAIELAAARTKSLPVPEIVERLGDRFRLLRRTPRGGPARHDGLEAAIDWSYDLLFADEQETFQRLAVFNGGATAAAVEHVCGPDGLDLAMRLVDRSLLVADTSGPTARFSMLESLRAYGCARLGAAGRLDDVRAEHLAWCVDLAERAAVGAQRADQLRWLDDLDAEHDNLRAALAHAVEHDPQAALRLAGALIRPWWFRGRRQEIREMATAALDAAGDRFPQLRAKVLANAALMAEPRHRGDGPPGTELHDDLVLAERDHREAIAIHAEHGGDPLEVAYAQLLLLATLTRRASLGESSRPGEADTLVDSAAAIFDAAGDDYGSALIRLTDAILAISEGDLRRAAADADAAAPFTRRLGERFSSARLAYVRGMLDDLAGNPRAAYRHIEQGLRLMSELGLHQAVAAQARMLVPLAERSGEPGLAAQWRKFIDDDEGVWTHYDGTVMAAAQNHAGLRARRAGDLAAAARSHRAALDWYRGAQLHAGVAVSATCLALVAHAAGDRAAAASHRVVAIDATELDEEDPVGIGAALLGAAAGAAAEDPATATELLGAIEGIGARAALIPPGLDLDAEELAGSLRERLGPDAFAAATAVGRRLDRRAAVVLAGADRIARPRRPAPG